jgi:uncharacterized protein (TIGR02444 family)
MSFSSGKKADLPVILPDTLELNNPLWHFALILWREPGVQENCLALQHQGWSVTRLLSAGWLALNNRAYTGIEAATLTEWRDRVTGSLRSVRQWLPKTGSSYQNLRNDLTTLELGAEQIELALVWHTLTHDNPENSTMQGRDTLIRHNLETAAPPSGSARRAALQLNALADILANFPKGGLPPW